MKQIKFYAMMMTAAAITLLSACGGEDEVKPDPKVNFKTTSGYSFGNTSVEVDSIVTAGILINHDRKIKNVKFQVTILGSTFTELDSNVNDKVIDMDFVKRVIATPGSETWTITATDADGKTGSVTLNITVTGQDQNLKPYEPAMGQKGVQIYNVKDPSAGNPSAYDLNTKTPASAASSDENLKDIVDANESTGAYQPKWTSKTGAMFLKVTSSDLTYSAASKYSELVEYYSTNTAGAVATTGVISTGDVYIVKAGDNGQYYLMSIINVEDVAGGASGDHVEFQFKTL